MSKKKEKVKKVKKVGKVEKAEEELIIRSIIGIFMNWHNYSPFIGNDQHNEKKIVPHAGFWFSLKELDFALRALSPNKRKSFVRHVMNGEKQSAIARSREKSQALVWYEIKTACLEISKRLLED